MKKALILSLILGLIVGTHGFSHAAKSEGYHVQQEEYLRVSNLGKAWRDQFNISIFTGLRLCFGSNKSEAQLGEKILYFADSIAKSMRMVDETTLSDGEIGKIFSALYYNTDSYSDVELGQLLIRMSAVQKGLRHNIKEQDQPIQRVDIVNFGKVIYQLLSSEKALEDQGRLFTEVLETQLLIELQTEENIKRPSPQKTGKLGCSLAKKLITFKPSLKSYKDLGEIMIGILEEGALAKHSSFRQ